jgi:hypothetical protein
MVPTADAAMTFQITVRLKPDTTYGEVGVPVEEVGVPAGAGEVGIAVAA